MRTHKGVNVLEDLTVGQRALPASLQGVEYLDELATQLLGV